MINFVVLVHAVASASVALYLVSFIFLFPVPSVFTNSSFSISHTSSSVSPSISTLGTCHIGLLVAPCEMSTCPAVQRASCVSDPVLSIYMSLYGVSPVRVPQAISSLSLSSLSTSSCISSIISLTTFK